MTFIELMVVLTILVVAVSIFSRIVVATSRLRETNRENAIAGEAARITLEEMRGHEFQLVFSLYNSDPDDDPEGPGTAPGDRFTAPGLTPLGTASDGLVGRIIFPVPKILQADISGSEDGDGPLEDPATTEEAAPPPPPLTKSEQLREDSVHPRLGMPRDLNGDSIIDDEDHSDDYFILPVQIRIEWEGLNCPRSFDLYTMLTRFKQDA